jgi:hypothetical protein
LILHSFKNLIFYCCTDMSVERRQIYRTYLIYKCSLFVGADAPHVADRTTIGADAFVSSNNQYCHLIC